MQGATDWRLEIARDPGRTRQLYFRSRLTERVLSASRVFRPRNGQTFGDGRVQQKGVQSDRFGTGRQSQESEAHQLVCLVLIFH